MPAESGRVVVVVVIRNLCTMRGVSGIAPSAGEMVSLARREAKADRDAAILHRVIGRVDSSPGSLDAGRWGDRSRSRSGAKNGREVRFGRASGQSGLNESTRDARTL